MQKLAEARQRSYTYNKEELFLGDMTIASPIVNSQGLPVASVDVVAPTSRWTLDDAERHLGPKVIGCARAITNSIRA